MTLNQANLVNANANTNGTVKVTASKGFRFGRQATVARAVELA